MAVYKEPTEQDKYGNTTAFDIKRINYVTDGDVVKDNAGNYKILPRPAIAGKFDKNLMSTVVTVKYIDPTNQPIELEKVADAVEMLMNGVQPQCDNTGFEFRYNQSGQSVFLSYRDIDGGGVSQEFAVVSLLASGFALDEHFGSRLCAVFDVEGEKALENIPKINQSFGQKPLTLA